MPVVVVVAGGGGRRRGKAKKKEIKKTKKERGGEWLKKREKDFQPLCTAITSGGYISGTREARRKADWAWRKGTMAVLKGSHGVE